MASPEETFPVSLAVYGFEANFPLFPSQLSERSGGTQNRAIPLRVAVARLIVDRLGGRECAWIDRNHPQQPPNPVYIDQRRESLIHPSQANIIVKKNMS
jgi:hypothetical protein